MQPQKVSFAIFLSCSDWSDQDIFTDFMVAEGSSKWRYSSD